MDKFSIDIIKDKEKLQFDVIDFANSEDGTHCKFEVYNNNKMIASFEPDDYGFLHICKNNHEVDEETLYLIAGKLESINN